MMNYRNGAVVQIDDVVLYNKQKGRIVVLNQTASTGYIADDWKKEGSSTIVIEFENGALLQLDSSDDYLLELG